MAQPTPGHHTTRLRHYLAALLRGGPAVAAEDCNPARQRRRPAGAARPWSPPSPAAAVAAAAEAAPAEEMIHMSDGDRYLFDLQGFVVLKQVVPQDVLRAANEALDRLEALAPPCGAGAVSTELTVAGDLPPPCVLGDERTESNLYISNILEGDIAAFSPFIDIPAVLGVVADTAGGAWRLNHTYSICRWGGGQTMLHGAGTPVNLKTSYRCENGQMISALTKAVFPLIDSDAESGCFACM